METMKKELSEEKDSTMDIQHFISLIRKYKNPTEVSDLMFTELIDKIVVYCPSFHQKTYCIHPQSNNSFPCVLPYPYYRP